MNLEHGRHGRWPFLDTYWTKDLVVIRDWQYHRKATRHLWFQWKHLSPLNQQTSQRHLESDQKSAASSQTAGNQREENSAKDPAGRQSAKLRMWGILQEKKNKTSPFNKKIQPNWSWCTKFYIQRHFNESENVTLIFFFNFNLNYINLKEKYEEERRR